MVGVSCVFMWLRFIDTLNIYLCLLAVETDYLFSMCFYVWVLGRCPVGVLVLCLFDCLCGVESVLRAFC